MKALSERNQLPAAILIGLGIFFLASQVFGWSVGGMLWPLFIILPGLPFLYFALTGSKQHAGLIFPGLIISGTGLILLYQNTFNHYESWAYMWALYPVLVGIGLVFSGRRTGQRSEEETGHNMVRFGFAGFAAMAFLFEFLIFGGGFGLFGGVLLPIALILAGVLMWKRGGDKTADDEAYYEKAKNISLREKPKRSGPTPFISEELQRRIDEALTEEDRTPRA